MPDRALARSGIEQHVIGLAIAVKVSQSQTCRRRPNVTPLTMSEHGISARRSRPSSRFAAPTSLFRSKRPTLEGTRSRHHEDFLRIWIFNLATGRVSADVDQPSVGIEWIVDKTGFPWDRFRHRKLRLI